MLFRSVALWLLLLPLVASAQFPIQLGSAGQEYGKAMTTDRSGNILTALLFQNTIDFDPGPGSTVLGTPPGIDLAIVKHDKVGNLVWARHVTGVAPTAGTVSTPHGIATDASNNVYVIGYFGLTTNATPGVVDFDPGPGTLLVTNNGGWDPFIAKFSESGDILWARVLKSVTNSPLEERAWDLAVDDAGSVYVTGFFQGNYDLDAGPGTNLVTSAGEKDIFLVKYDANGNHLWGFALNDTGDAATSLKETSVALDGTGHVFLAGHYNNSLTVRGTGVNTLTLTNASVTTSDFFVARYDTNGALQTAVRIGGTLAETAPPGTMRCDGAGNVYFTLRFRGIVDLDPGAAIFSVTNLTAPAADDIAVVSLDNNLAFRWGFAIPSDGGLDGGHRVAFDTQTNVFVAGWYNGNTDFSHGLGTGMRSNVNAHTGGDIFLAKYDRSGSFLWVATVGGFHTNATDSSITAGLTVDFDGNPYVSGQLYGSNWTFNPTPPFALPFTNSVGQNDAYVFKYDTFTGKLFADADQDGLPDEWEDANGLNKSDPADAVLDSDGDGFSNLAEFRAGTNPLDATSALSILSVGRTENSILLAVPAVTGRSYQIEFKDALTNSTWSALTNVHALSNATWQVNDPGANLLPQRFYRVRLTP